MSMDNCPQSNEIIEKLGRKMQELSTVTVLFHQKIAQNLGLNPTDHKCLDLIMKNDYMTAGELAQVTGLTTGAITGVIDRLEAKELVKREKDPNDRRKIMVVANKEKALNEVSPFFTSLGTAMNELYNQYSEKELHTILDFVTKSVEIVEGEVNK
jgi:DNA-binding MarR family transcriptional regulator